jgi:hypothetical protein
VELALTKVVTLDAGSVSLNVLPAAEMLICCVDFNIPPNVFSFCLRLQLDDH